jgi:hypothetical protein
MHSVLRCDHYKVPGSASEGSRVRVMVLMEWGLRASEQVRTLCGCSL